MASFLKRKGSNYYYLKVKRRGVWVREATDIRIDSVDGLRRIRKLVAEESALEHAGLTDRYGWDWVPAFFKRRYATNAKSLARYGAAWSALEIWMEEMDIAGPSFVTYQLCVSYPEWRTNVNPALMKPCTWNTALTEVKTLGVVLSEAVRRGMIQASPCVRLGLRRRNVKKKPEITLEEQEKIEQALNALPKDQQWMSEMWLVAMCQGVRLNETGVTLDRIDLQAGTFSVIGKGDKIHTGPLHEQVRPLVEKALKEKRRRLVEFPQNSSKLWSKFFRKQGLGHITFHSTRVTVVTRLARSGASKPQVMAYVGHASETVNDVYIRLTAPDVAHLGALLGTGKPSCNPKPGKKGDPSASPKPKKR